MLVAQMLLQDMQSCQKAMSGMAMSSGALCHVQYDRQLAVYQKCRLSHATRQAASSVPGMPRAGPIAHGGNAMQFRLALQHDRQ